MNESGAGNGASRRDRDTAEALLDAATRQFAAEGYDGASIRDITRAAGANLGAVTYHFGSKRALYRAVLARCFEPVRRGVVAAAGAPGTALDRIDAILRVFFDAVRTQPAIPPLMIRETVSGRKPGAPELEPVRRIVGCVTEVIEDGQASGLIRAGDPMLLAISTIAQPVHLALMSRLLLVSEGEGDAERSRLLAHAVRYARRGLSREDLVDD